MKKNRSLLYKTVLMVSLFVFGIALFFSLQKLPLQNRNLQSATQLSKTVPVSNNRQVKASQTATEQEQINAHILTNWGTPSSDKLVALEGVYNDDNIPFTYLSGEYWYYLTGDVFFNLKKPVPTFDNATKINLLLNGYSIDGNIYFVFKSTESAFKIYDTLPNQNLEYTKRNPVEKHYYSYNSNTESYDTYSTTVPAGSREETNLPTFTKGSYITVEGSRIGANSLSSQYMATRGSNNKCYIKVSGDLHLFGINIIGKQNTYSGSTKNGLIYTDTKQTSSIEIIQCNILGNTLVKSGYSGAVNIFSQGDNKVIKSKIYGNKVNQNSIGVEMGHCKYNDFVLSYSGVPGMLKTLYASNIGALTGGHANAAIYSILGVDFGNQLIEQKITIKNFHTLLQNLSNLSGTIELVNNIQLEYNGNSPNLQFTIREKEVYADSTEDGIVKAITNTTTQPDNQLTLNTNAQIKGVDISGGKLLQNGKILANISMHAGSLEVLAQGVIAGQLNMTGGEAIVHDSATVVGAINCSQGKLTIKDGANVDWNKVNRKSTVSQTHFNKSILLIVAIGISIIIIIAMSILFTHKKRKQKKKVR